MDTSVVELTTEQFDELLTALNNINLRLNTIISDSHNYFYFALLLAVIYGMGKLIYSFLEPFVVDY